ncbi:hypothetical protein MMPV_000859 [Pyropia vietnamensis]
MEQAHRQHAAAVTARLPTLSASAAAQPSPRTGATRPTPMPSPSRCALAFLTHPPAVATATCAAPVSSTAPPPAAVIAPATPAARSIPEVGVVMVGAVQPPCGRRVLPRLAPRPTALPVRTGDGGTSSCDSGGASGWSAAEVGAPSAAPCGRPAAHQAVPTQALACGAFPGNAPAASSPGQVAPGVPLPPSSICSTGASAVRGTSPPAAAPVLNPASPCSGSIGSSSPSPVSSPALAGVPPPPATPSAVVSGGDGEAGGPARRRRRRGSRVEKDTPPRELRRVLRNRELARVSNEKRRVRLACMQGEMEALRTEVVKTAAERDAALARVADLEAMLHQGAGRVSPPPPRSALMAAPAVAPSIAPAVATPVSVVGEVGSRMFPLSPHRLSAHPVPAQQPVAVTAIRASEAFRPPLRLAQGPSAPVSIAPARAGAHMLLQAAAVEMA